MTANAQKPQRRRFAWGAVAAVLLLVSAIGFSAPAAFAEGSDAQAAEAQRYFQIFENVYQFILQNYVDEVEAERRGPHDVLGHVGRHLRRLLRPRHPDHAVALQRGLEPRQA
mgnify:CR=1 FL=1